MVLPIILLIGAGLVMLILAILFIFLNPWVFVVLIVALIALFLLKDSKFLKASPRK